MAALLKNGLQKKCLVSEGVLIPGLFWFGFGIIQAASSEVASLRAPPTGAPISPIPLQRPRRGTGWHLARPPILLRSSPCPLHGYICFLGQRFPTASPKSGFLVFWLGKVTNHPHPTGVAAACHDIPMGDRFIQLGNFRLADIDGNHFSVSHKATPKQPQTLQVVRGIPSDGDSMI